MQKPVKKKVFVSGQDEKFDPAVHLDLRFGFRRRAQLGKLDRGDVVLNLEEIGKLESEPQNLATRKGRGFAFFPNRRR